MGAVNQADLPGALLQQYRDVKVLFSQALNLQEYSLSEEGPIVRTSSLHKLICVANINDARVSADNLRKSSDGVPLAYKYVPINHCAHIVDYELLPQRFVPIQSLFKSVPDPSSEPSGVYDSRDFTMATIDEHIDGDTFWVKIDGARSKVRLLGIDTPESVSPDRYKNTIAGHIASAYTKRLLELGSPVWLQKDVEDEDKYHRLLRYVWKQRPADPLDPHDVYKYMVNAILLAKGYATALRIAPNLKYARMFQDGPPVDEDNVPYIDSEDAAGVLRVNCGPIAKLQIHPDLGTFKTFPTIPCAVLNNSMYAFGPNNLLHLYMRQITEVDPDTGEADPGEPEFVSERVRPIEIDPSWSVVYGYNMLKTFPYNFVNNKGPSWELFGCLPYSPGTDDVRMNYKPNEAVEFVLNYQSRSDKFEDPSNLSDGKVYLDIGYKIVSDNEYLSMFRTEPGEVLALTPGETPNVSFILNIPNEDFMLRATLSYYLWADDVLRKTMYHDAALVLYKEATALGNTSPFDYFYDTVSVDCAGLPLVSYTVATGKRMEAVEPYPVVNRFKTTLADYNAGVEAGTIAPGVFTSQAHYEHVLANDFPARLKLWEPHKLKVSDNDKYMSLKRYGFFMENIIQEATYSFTGGRSMMKDYGSTRGILLEKYNLSTAVGMVSWKQRLVLWGVKDAPDLIFTSDMSLPAYFPFPNGVIQYEKPIVHVITFLDSLLVFTQDAIYKTVLSEDGWAFNTETVALNVHFTQYDIPSICVVKNMVFYKSDNYYYMLVPSSKILTIGELKVAPVSRPINYFLDHFDAELRLILNDMYSGVFDRVDILDPTKFYITSDYYEVHAVGGVVKMNYTFKIGRQGGGKKTRIMFTLKYDTSLRTWTVDLIELPTGQVYLYNQNVATGPEYLALHTVGNKQATLSLLSEDVDINTDMFDNVGKILGTTQYLDTGFREIDSSWKKRFRELQIKLHNKTSSPLELHLAFALDNVHRTSLSGYNLPECTPLDTEVHSPGHAVLAPEEPAPAEENKRTWLLDEQTTRFGGSDTIRWRVSGKGYCPRMRLLSKNEKSYEILGNTWIYRKLNAR